MKMVGKELPSFFRDSGGVRLLCYSVIVGNPSLVYLGGVDEYELLG